MIEINHLYIEGLLSGSNILDVDKCRNGQQLLGTFGARSEIIFQNTAMLW